MKCSAFATTTFPTRGSVREVSFPARREDGGEVGLCGVVEVRSPGAQRRATGPEVARCRTLGVVRRRETNRAVQMG